MLSKNKYVHNEKGHQITNQPSGWWFWTWEGLRFSNGKQISVDGPEIPRPTTWEMYKTL